MRDLAPWLRLPRSRSGSSWVPFAERAPPCVRSRSLGREYLSLYGTRISAAGIRELREKLPKCDIEWEAKTEVPRDQKR